MTVFATGRAASELSVAQALQDKMELYQQKGQRTLPLHPMVG